MTGTDTISRAGVIYAVLSYLIWGVLPIYWKLIAHVPAPEILAHRILWSFIFVGILLFKGKQVRLGIEALKDKKKIGLLLLSGVAISFNWGLYIWAVNTGRIVEASMGYYMNPLLAVLLGMIIFKEKLNNLQKTAIVFAFAGVCVIALQYGSIPWVSFTLAASFGLYGMLKKITGINSLVGLAFETLLMTPIALIYILTKQAGGTGAFGSTSMVTLLLLGSGIVTATPLLLFAKGVRRIPLSTMGFIQYMAPTISLLIGVLLYKETFSMAHLLGFGLIWTGIAIFTMSQIKVAGELKAKKITEVTGS